MFIAEGLLLSVFGVLIGNILSLAAIYAIRFSHYTFSFGMKEGFVLSPIMTFSDVLYISLVVIVVSVLGSLQPALKASRVEPIKALKSV